MTDISKRLGQYTFHPYESLHLTNIFKNSIDHLISTFASGGWESPVSYPTNIADINLAESGSKPKRRWACEKERGLY